MGLANRDMDQKDDSKDWEEQVRNISMFPGLDPEALDFSEEEEALEKEVQEMEISIQEEGDGLSQEELDAMEGRTPEPEQPKPLSDSHTLISMATNAINEAVEMEEESIEDFEEKMKKVHTVPPTNKKEFTGEGKNVNPLERVAPLMTDDRYIEERVDDQINYYNKKSSHHQSSYKKKKRIEFIINSAVPVIITFSTMSFVETKIFSWGEGVDAHEVTIALILQIIAAVGGVIVVILTKFMEMEGHYKLWKEYRSTCEALQHERMMYLTRTEPYDEDDAFPRFVDKIESILNNETQKWKHMSRQENSAKKNNNNSSHQTAAVPSQIANG